MPLNSDQLAYLYKNATDNWGKNKPIDQINPDRVLLPWLEKSAENYTGGPFLTTQLYKDNGDTGAGYSGYQRVSYSEARPLEQAKYRKGNYHIGRVISEDELRTAGVHLTSDKSAQYETSEKVVLTNMLESMFTQMDNGEEEGMEKSLWLDGSQDAELTPGVDALVSLTPAVGTIGGLDAATNTWWRNHAATGVGGTLANVTDALEAARRAVRRTGGRTDKIYAGGTIYDVLRTAAMSANQTQINYSGGSALKVDFATNDLRFDGVKIEWVPEFDTNFGGSAPTIPWSKRLYMLDSRHLKLVRDKTNFRRLREPGRPIDQYAFYFGKTSTYGLTTGKRNAHAVISVA